MVIALFGEGTEILGADHSCLSAEIDKSARSRGGAGALAEASSVLLKSTDLERKYLKHVLKLYPSCTGWVYSLRGPLGAPKF